MDNVQLSKANEVYISQQSQNKNTTTPIQPQVQQVEDGENKMNKVLLGLGILGAAAIGLTCAIRGKQVKKQPKTDDVQKLVKEFGDINFNKGTAKLKDGTLFTGTVEKVSKNGDKLSMEYVDGVLKKSSNKVNGTETIKEYTNGIVTKKNGQAVDIKKVQDEVKSQQEKLKNLLANNELSSQDFKMQTDEIKFKSKKQEAEIKSIFDKKVKAQEAAKAEADRLAQEAKEKAQKEEAERLAKEQQEVVPEKAQTTCETLNLAKTENYKSVILKSKNANGADIQYIINLDESKGAYDAITGTSLYFDYGPHNDAARARMFTTNHELPSDWLEAYKNDYRYYNQGMFPSLKEFAQHASDPKIALNAQLKELRKIPPANEEYFLYRGINTNVIPKEVVSILNEAKSGDIIIPDWGVACATPDPNYAVQHYSSGGLLRIKTPIGARLAGLYKDGYPEFHMPSLSEYKFIQKQKVDDLCIYDLEYIMPSID